MATDPVIIFRPLAKWPREKNPAPTHSTFKAGWNDTLLLLHYELSRLEVHTATLHLDVEMNEIRANGSLRGQVTPRTPRVMLICDSRYGPLSYPCDAFWNWRDNVRAIALGLQDLRRLERYRISTRGEQYTGFKQLMQGGEPTMTVEEAAAFVEQHSEIPAAAMLREIGYVRFAYKIAAGRTHPDVAGTGSSEAFKRLQRAKELLEAHHGEKL